MLYKFQRHEQLIINAFREAVTQGEFLLKLPDVKSAQLMRVRAYSVAKTVKRLAEKGEISASVRDDMLSVSLTVVDEGLLFRLKSQDPLMLLLEAQLGERAGGLDPAAQAMADMGARLSAAASVSGVGGVAEAVSAAEAKASLLGARSIPEVRAELPVSIGRRAEDGQHDVLPSGENLNPYGQRMPPGFVWNDALKTCVKPKA